MKTLYILFVILLTSCWSFAQYPFVHLPYSILDELGTMEVPLDQLPALELIWDNKFWNDRIENF